MSSLAAVRRAGAILAAGWGFLFLCGGAALAATPASGGAGLPTPTAVPSLPLPTPTATPTLPVPTPTALPSVLPTPSVTATAVPTETTPATANPSPTQAPPAAHHPAARPPARPTAHRPPVGLPAGFRLTGFGDAAVLFNSRALAAFDIPDLPPLVSQDATGTGTAPLVAPTPVAPGSAAGGLAIPHDPVPGGLPGLLVVTATVAVGAVAAGHVGVLHQRLANTAG